MKAVESGQLKSSKCEDSFTTQGYSNWKNATTAFRKHDISDCHKEAIDIHTLPEQCEDIALTMQRSLSKKRQVNCRMLHVIIRSIKYLAWQGLALRGDSSDEGNFIQLLKLQSETDPALQAWLTKEREKYTSGEIQNAILRIMANSILRKISKHVHDNAYYALMADEVTDSSNREQFVICFHWVDSDSFSVNEDLIGFYQVDNITASTLFSSLKDVLLRLIISISKSCAQCYDGTSNMVGVRSGIASLIQREEPRAILVHCYGHSLQLAVSDTVKKIKTMADALDTTNEISKLLKYSPKRDTLYEKMKQELAPDTPGFRRLCPTQWTVRANSLQGVIDSWLPLRELWDECLTQRLDSEVKSQIIGVKHQMSTFEYFFGTSLGILLLKHNDNLSKTLQHSFMLASEGQSVPAMTVSTLELMRSDEQFDMFWSKVTKKANELELSEPVLPCKRKRPVRYEDGQVEAYYPDTPKSLYKAMYFRSLDVIISCIKTRFDHPGYHILRQLESLLLKAVNQESFTEKLEAVSCFYNNEVDKGLLETHLSTLSSFFHTSQAAARPATFNDQKEFIAKLSKSQKSLISQDIFLYRMVLLASPTNAVSERSCSALRRTKTWLRTTMNQDRLNYSLLLHTHQTLTK
ncbi:PREDICTED: zinc finger MYM-type protein 1-like [Amphimedon queenslandica]|uniref:DUF4371 domain-containing protein n=1 Tax=Amphimedon queenslandica TaxID=400682 RepID=A0A1X7VBE6_AMPQE|nr:PREDICTED: zinc finger MYM-type protein 1-like [Amphimedon queenslandica]|eukprot:XP_011402633.1 PREDICTED: zinc finger MYM-type protein 1-like [Amphimedon queenslandica]